MNREVLKLKNISKSFAKVKVLNDISLDLREGTVTTLIGENGAGKSTLCNIIVGDYGADSGSIEIGGRSYEQLTIQQAKELGIRMVHQELLVLPQMTVMENIFVGEEYEHFGFLNEKEMTKRTEELLDMVGLNLSPNTRVQDLGIAARQMVEIARALNGNAKIIILDEPTSSLSNDEIQNLFAIVNKLKQQGVSFLFISHRMQEVMEISDEIVVLRDGELVAKLDAGHTDETEIVRLMVGRDYSNYFNRTRTCFGDETLRIEHMSGVDSDEYKNSYTPKDVNLSLYKGEILGLYGLVGAGRTELVRLIFGLDPHEGSGKIFAFGKEVTIKDSGDAMNMGMAWLTEDRKDEGLIISFSVKENIALPNLKAICSHGLLDKSKEISLYEKFSGLLNIKCTGPDQVVKYLSGGNQQKIILAKWLARNPEIIIMDEPTRGIDVGAKTEIYKIMNELTEKGASILLISSELPEIMGMSDRMLIMHEGNIVGELNKDEFSEEKIMTYAVGG